MTAVDPTALHDAWTAAGQPQPNWAGRSRTPKPPPPQRHGICALTGITGQVVPIRHVLSDLFTTWDRLPFLHTDPQGPALSLAAAWAFRHRPFQQHPSAHLPQLEPAFQTDLTPNQLHTALTHLNGHGFVCVPISRQKHVLPFATRGHVRVDDEHFPWTDNDRHLLQLVTKLRALGFGETALTEPAPRWPTLRKLDPDTTRFVLNTWRELDPWRTHPARLAVACRATRNNPPENPDA